MRFARLAASAFAVLALWGFPACVTPGVTLVGWEPSPALDPRGADHLVLVDAEGRASAKRVVNALVRDEARGRYFIVDDRGDTGVKLTLAGQRATVEGGGPARSNELWLRIDVLRWDAMPIVLRDEDAEGGPVDIPGIRGHADLQFSIARADGGIVIREREVRGVADVEAPADGVVDGRATEQAIVLAARMAVASIIDEISPRRRTSTLAFDMGDSGQRRILESEDTLVGRERRLRRYLRTHDGNAIAMHNLAVVLSAQGRFEEALAMHDAALAIVARDGFAEARRETDRRRTMWIRMFGERPSSASSSSSPSAAPPTAPAGATATAPPAP